MPICLQVNVKKMLTLCRSRRVLIAVSAVATVLSVVDGVLVEADVWLRRCWFFLVVVVQD